MRNKEQVKDFIKFFKKPVSIFAMNTTKEIIDELINEGYIVSVGLKYDATQKNAVEKYVKTNKLTTGYIDD